MYIKWLISVQKNCSIRQRYSCMADTRIQNLKLPKVWRKQGYWDGCVHDSRHLSVVVAWTWYMGRLSDHGRGFVYEITPKWAQFHYQYTKRVALQLGAEGWYFLPGPFCKAHVIDFIKLSFLFTLIIVIGRKWNRLRFYAWASLSRHRVSSGSCADAALKISVSEECIANALAW